MGVENSSRPFAADGMAMQASIERLKAIEQLYADEPESQASEFSFAVKARDAHRPGEGSFENELVDASVDGMLGIGGGIAGGLLCSPTLALAPLCAAGGAAFATGVGKSIYQKRTYGKVDPGSVVGATLVNAFSVGTAALPAQAAKLAAKGMFVKGLAWAGTQATLGNTADAVATYAKTGKGKDFWDRLFDKSSAVVHVLGGALVHGVSKAMLPGAQKLRQWIDEVLDIGHKNPGPLADTAVYFARKAAQQEKNALTREIPELRARARKQLQEMHLYRPPELPQPYLKRMPEIVQAKVELREAQLAVRRGYFESQGWAEGLPGKAKMNWTTKQRLEKATALCRYEMSNGQKTVLMLAGERTHLPMSSFEAHGTHIQMLDAAELKKQVFYDDDTWRVYADMLEKLKG